MNRSPRGHGKPFKFQQAYNVLVSLVEERRKRSRNLVPDSTACKVGSLKNKGKERQEPTLKVQNCQSRLVLDIFILNLFPILFPARVSAGPSKGPHLRRPGFRLVRLPSLTCLIFSSSP